MSMHAQDQISFEVVCEQQMINNYETDNIEYVDKIDKTKVQMNNICTFIVVRWYKN